MKKILVLILILILGAGLYLGNAAQTNQKISSFIWQSSCDAPIPIKIGALDPKFNLSSEQFLTDINEAANTWNSAWGKNLFVVSPKAKLKINLVYDERQSLTSQINNLQGKLNQNKDSLKPEIQAYEQKVQDFQNKLQQLNSEINYWNSRGGAPSDQYNKLIKEQQDLKVTADSLNAQAKALNLQTQDYNSQVNALNSTVQDFNQTIAQKPEEGLYDPSLPKIDIYFIVNQKELIHTLAHELGHSLGMEHNQNPKSIMYPLTNQQLTLSKDDLASLQQVCQKHNILELAGIRLGLLLNYYQTLINHK